MRWRTVPTAVLLGVLILGGLTGCVGSRETRFYLLTPVAADAIPGAASPHFSAIGLHPVVLPEYLDRPQIITRLGENMLELAEFDQWGSPLRDHLTRVLAGNLMTLLPADRVAVFPWRKDAPVGYEVAVEVRQLEGTLGADCVLIADWAVLDAGGKNILTHGRFNQTAPAGKGYPTLVAAESRLVADLARDITAALRVVAR